MEQNEQNEQKGLGYDFAHPTSRLAQFMDEQHSLLEKTRNELIMVSHELKKAKEEAEYWRLLCNKIETDSVMLRAEKVRRGCCIDELKEEIRKLKAKE